MDRRKFLRLIPAVVAAGVIAPKLLIPEEPVKLAPMQLVQPINWKNKLSTIRDNYYIGCDPVVSDRVYIMFTGKQGLINFNKAIDEYAKYYIK